MGHTYLVSYKGIEKSYQVWPTNKSEVGTRYYGVKPTPTQERGGHIIVNLSLTGLRKQRWEHCPTGTLFRGRRTCFSSLSLARPSLELVMSTGPPRPATLICPSKFQSVQTSGPLHLAVFCARSSFLSSARGEGVSCLEATLHGPSLGVCGLRFPRWFSGQGGAPGQGVVPGLGLCIGSRAGELEPEGESAGVCVCALCQTPRV